MFNMKRRLYDTIMVLLLTVINITASGQSVILRGNMVSQHPIENGSMLHLTDTTCLVSFDVTFSKTAAHYYKIVHARESDSCCHQMPIMRWKKDLSSGHRLVVTPLLRCADDFFLIPTGSPLNLTVKVKDYQMTAESGNVVMQQEVEWGDTVDDPESIISMKEPA